MRVAGPCQQLGVLPPTRPVLRPCEPDRMAGAAPVPELFLVSGPQWRAEQRPKDGPADDPPHHHPPGKVEPDLRVRPPPDLVTADCDASVGYLATVGRNGHGQYAVGGRV